MDNFKKIRPKDLDFRFDFTKDECHKVLTGTCSLEKEFKYKSSKKIAMRRSDECYCQCLCLAMCESFPLPRDISIDKAIKCGHYSFTNGRHRVCIAQKKDLSVIAEVLYDQNDFCVECEKLK